MANPKPAGFGGLDDVDRTFSELFASKVPDDLVGMRDAVEETCLQMVGRRTAIPDMDRNSVADILSRRTALYSVSNDGRTVRALSAEEVRSGRFIDGGQVLAFRDRRDAVRGLAVRRLDLAAAIEAMRPK